MQSPIFTQSQEIPLVTNSLPGVWVWLSNAVQSSAFSPQYHNTATKILLILVNRVPTFLEKKCEEIKKLKKKTLNPMF